MTEIDPSPINFHAIAVTYRRPKILRSTLESFLSQTRPPDSILVVDNGADNRVEAMVAELDRTRYLSMPENVGPAGGFAAGIEEALRRCAPSDWILLIDDDNPARFGWLLEELLDAAERSSSDVAAVGQTGARYDLRTGNMNRVVVSESEDWTDIDYVGSGQLPLYRVAAIREVGTMNSGLFFGFEDLEYGLRLKAAGWRLVISNAVKLRIRKADAEKPYGSRQVEDSRPALWRSYYSARNEVLIARSFGRWSAAPAVTLRAIAGGLKEALRSRSGSELKVRLLGLSHGWRGRVGRTVPPSALKTRPLTAH